MRSNQYLVDFVDDTLNVTYGEKLVPTFIYYFVNTSHNLDWIDIRVLYGVGSSFFFQFVRVELPISFCCCDFNCFGLELEYDFACPVQIDQNAQKKIVSGENLILFQNETIYIHSICSFFCTKIKPTVDSFEQKCVAFCSSFGSIITFLLGSGQINFTQKF